MAEMSPASVRAFVRTYFDTDEEELPNELLNVWVSEARDRCLLGWEEFDSFTMAWLSTSLTNGQFIFNIQDGDGRECFAPKSIIAVEPRRPIRYVPHGRALEKYGFDSGDTTNESVCEWSQYGEQIFLWPTPTDALTADVYGVRSPDTSWTADDSANDDQAFDIPNEFHPLIADFVLARCYEQQDDDVMSVQKFNKFEMQLDTLRRRHTRPPNPGLQVVGGGSGITMPGRLRYDWEF